MEYVTVPVAAKDRIRQYQPAGTNPPTEEAIVMTEFKATAKVIVWAFVKVSIVVQFAPVEEFVAQISKTNVPDDAPPIVVVPVIVTGY